MISRHYGIERMPRVKTTALNKIRPLLAKLLKEIKGGVQSEAGHAC